jgi:hypothetical protein
MKYRFRPHPGITAYEVALLLAKFDLCVSEETYEALSPEERRHFTQGAFASGIGIDLAAVQTEGHS